MGTQGTPPKATFTPTRRNKALVAGLIKGNQWLIGSHDFRPSFVSTAWEATGWFHPSIRDAVRTWHPSVMPRAKQSACASQSRIKPFRLEKGGWVVTGVSLKLPHGFWGISNWCKCMVILRDFPKIMVNGFTLPETNSKFAPENGWLEYEKSFWGPAYFQGWSVSFRECSVEIWNHFSIFFEPWFQGWWLI